MNLFGRGKNSGEPPIPAEGTPETSALPFPDYSQSEGPSPQSEAPRSEGEGAPSPFVEAPYVAETSENDPVRLSALIAGLETRLIAAFDEKLATDSHKERQIDRLHEELQTYKSDLVSKATRPMASALIKAHTDTGRIIASLAESDPSKLTPERVASLFLSFKDDLETVLAEQGIETYRAGVGARFDPRRHMPVKTIPAPSPELAGTVAQSLGSGFEHAGTVIEREKVSVYSAASETPSDRQAQ